MPSLHASKGRRKSQPSRPDNDEDEDGDGHSADSGDAANGADDSDGTIRSVVARTPTGSLGGSTAVPAPPTAAARTTSDAPTATTTSRAGGQRQGRAQRPLMLGEELSSGGLGMEGLPGVDPFKD